MQTIIDAILTVAGVLSVAYLVAVLGFTAYAFAEAGLRRLGFLRRR